MGDRREVETAYSVSMESRESPVVTRSPSSASDPQESGKDARPKSVPGDGNIGSDETGLSVPSTHVEAVSNLARMFESNTEPLDLAIMQVIAEGGSPSEWVAGMLRASLPPEPVEPSPRPRFLGE